jgi:hypothetical protein
MMSLACCIYLKMAMSATNRVSHKGAYPSQASCIQSLEKSLVHLLKRLAREKPCLGLAFPSLVLIFNLSLTEACLWTDSH